MSQTPQTQPRRYTLEEYFRLECESQVKHEFRHGELINMSGGTPSHSLISANVSGELRNRLRGSPCRVYDSNFRIRIGRKVCYAYPDSSVICREIELDPDDPTQMTAINPRLVVEVLSPSTEVYDRVEKLRYYLELESLQEYVLVAQDAPRVETLFRQPAGTWLLAFATGTDAVARLRSLHIDLPLNEVYGGVQFPAPVDDAP